MKNQTPKHRSPDLFTNQIHGRNPRGMVERAMPHSNPTGNKDMFENILRWEEDGGKIVEANSSTLAQVFVQPIRPADHDQAVSDDTRNRRNPMHKKVGLWLDRSKAVIVSIADKVEGKRIITSDMEHYVLYSAVVPGDGSPEDIRDRRFWNHLGEYYDKIIAHIRDATEIQIFGPAEAKYELQKRLESEGLAEYVVSLEDAGKLSDLQIAAKVQKRFPIRSRFDIS